MSRGDEPTYPIQPNDQVGSLTEAHSGMTIREALAKDMMKGILSNATLADGGGELVHYTTLAVGACGAADALLAVLAKKPEDNS